MMSGQQVSTMSPHTCKGCPRSVQGGRGALSPFRGPGALSPFRGPGGPLPLQGAGGALSPFRGPGGPLPLQGAGGPSPPSGGRGALSPFRGPGGPLPLQGAGEPSPPSGGRGAPLPLQGAGGHNPDARTKGAECKSALRGEMSHNVPLQAKHGEPPPEVKWRQMAPNDTPGADNSPLRTPDGGPPTSDEGCRERAIPAQGSAEAAPKRAERRLPTAGGAPEEGMLQNVAECYTSAGISRAAASGKPRATSKAG